MRFNQVYQGHGSQLTRWRRPERHALHVEFSIVYHWYSPSSEAWVSSIKLSDNISAVDLQHASRVGFAGGAESCSFQY
jgi:hypothetical protein